ncbi:hypothetical protein Hanom_Chr00s000390g01641691 [Helianthus anomalus]
MKHTYNVYVQTLNASSMKHAISKACHKISSRPTNMQTSANQEVFTGCNIRLGRRVWK